MDYFKMMTEVVREQAKCNNGHVFDVPAIAKCPECGSRYVERLEGNLESGPDSRTAVERLMLENARLHQKNNEHREHISELRESLVVLHNYLRAHGSAKDTLSMLQRSHRALYGHLPDCRRGEILVDEFNPARSRTLGCTCAEIPQ